jgi:rare lipoprotein A (peptidoglycan hydrolase)
LLQNGTAHAQRESDPTSLVSARRLLPASRLDDVTLPSHLVAYQAPTTTTVPVPAATPTTQAAPPPTTTPTTAPRPVVTTTTAPAPQPVLHGNSENGQATWYPQAGPGTCASHTLPRGTVVTVTNDATGAHTTCLIDDYEAAGYPRVLDMSYSGFSQIGDPSQGVVDVTISW